MERITTTGRPRSYSLLTLRHVLLLTDLDIFIWVLVFLISPWPALAQQDFGQEKKGGKFETSTAGVGEDSRTERWDLEPKMKAFDRRNPETESERTEAMREYYRLFSEAVDPLGQSLQIDLSDFHEYLPESFGEIDRYTISDIDPKGWISVRPVPSNRKKGPHYTFSLEKRVYSDKDIDNWRTLRLSLAESTFEEGVVIPLIAFLEKDRKSSVSSLAISAYWVEVAFQDLQLSYPAYSLWFRDDATEEIFLLVTDHSLKGVGRLREIALLNQSSEPVGAATDSDQGNGLAEFDKGEASPECRPMPLSTWVYPDTPAGRQWKTTPESVEEDPDALRVLDNYGHTGLNSFLDYHTIKVKPAVTCDCNNSCNSTGTIDLNSKTVIDDEYWWHTPINQCHRGPLVPIALTSPAFLEREGGTGVFVNGVIGWGIANCHLFGDFCFCGEIEVSFSGGLKVPGDVAELSAGISVKVHDTASAGDWTLPVAIQCPDCAGLYRVQVKAAGVLQGETLEVLATWYEDNVEHGQLKTVSQVAPDNTEMTILLDEGVPDRARVTVEARATAVNGVKRSCTADAGPINAAQLNLSTDCSCTPATSSYTTDLLADKNQCPAGKRVSVLLVGDLSDTPSEVTVTMAFGEFSEGKTFSWAALDHFDNLVPAGTDLSFVVTPPTSSSSQPRWECYANPPAGIMGNEDFPVEVTCSSIPGWNLCEWDVSFCQSPPDNDPACFASRHEFGYQTAQPVRIDTNGDGKIDEGDEVRYLEYVLTIVRWVVACLGDFLASSPGIETKATSSYTAPVVGIYHPQEGSTQQGEIEIRGVAFDVEDGLAGLHFFVDGSRVSLRDVKINEPDPTICDGWLAAEGGPCTPDAIFHGILDISTLSDGNHKIQVVAQNNHPTWKLATSQEINIVVDNSDSGSCSSDDVPPVVSLTSLADGSTIPEGSTLIGASATDASGILQVSFVVDGVEQAWDAEAPFRFQWAPTPGTYRVEAVASDICGNQGSSGPVSVVVEVDSCTAVSVDSVSLTFPAEGAVLIEGAPVTLSATASDQNGIERVRFRKLQNGSWSGLNNDYDEPYEFQWTVEPGVTQVSARAFNICGSIADSTHNVTVVPPCDGVLDSIELTSPATGATLVEGESVTLGATASDQHGIVAVDFTMLQDGIWKPLGRDEAAPYSWVWTAEPGVTRLAARAYDVCGSNRAVINVVTVEPPCDGVLDSVELTSPAPGATLMEGESVVLSANAADLNGVDRVRFVKLQDGIWSVIAVDYDEPYSLQWTAEPGVIRIAARAYDTCGSHRAVTHSVTVVQPPMAQVSYGANILTYDETLDFGAFQAGSGTKNRGITVQNVAALGAMDLDWGTVTVANTEGAAFSWSGTLVSPLAPGASDNFAVSLNTSTPGTYRARVEVWHSDPTVIAPHRFFVTGTVTAPPPPRVQVSHDTNVLSYDETYDFGTFEEGGGIKNRGITVKNIAALGASSLGWGTVTVVNTQGSAFSWSGTLVSPLAPGASDNFAISLDTSTAGSYRARVKVWHSDPSVTNPHRFYVTGTVTARPPAAIQVSFGTNVLLQDEVLDFGTYSAAAATKNRGITVANVAPAGSSDLIVDSVAVQNTAGAAFGFSGSVASPLAPGAADNFALTFSTATAGTFEATVSVHHQIPGVTSPRTFIARVTITP